MRTSLTPPYLPRWLCCAVLAWALACGVSHAAEIPGLLLGELNCVACHSATARQQAWITRQRGPLLSELGARTDAAWLQHFLAAPQQTMPGATMPDLLRGNTENAEALTHYLLANSGSERFRRIVPDKAAVARGESLYHSIGCVACHAPFQGQAQPANSISLPDMVAKWSFDGLRRFLLDPLATYPSGRMPGMHLSEGEASDLAHYLLRETRVPSTIELSLYRGRIPGWNKIDSAERVRTIPISAFNLDGPARDRNSALRYTAWLLIDQPGDYSFALKATGSARLLIEDQWLLGKDSWDADKLSEQAKVHLEKGRHKIVVEFAGRGQKNPALNVQWQKPGGASLAPIPENLLSATPEPIAAASPFVLDEAKREKGRRLYAILNCAACHETKASTQSLPKLTALRLDQGCLAENSPAIAPQYHLGETQRKTLRADLKALQESSLDAPTEAQRVSHTMSTFRCFSCHSRNGQGGVTPDRNGLFTSNVDDLGDEGRLPPRLDGVGNKLRPEWLAKVLEQGASVRTYLNTRMPQFGAANVGHLADLFIHLDRKATPLPTNHDTPAQLRDVGRKLVGTDGLSCIVCHQFNHQPAHTLQALDLITVPERLNQDWFRAFLLNPNYYHPGTRMPALWPGGRSLLPAVLDGDTGRQHAAIWAYLSEALDAKFPEGLSRQSMELVVGGDAVVYRGKMWEAGFRALATGYPGHVNMAFDAEDVRLALLWKGRFLNVSPHWSVQGMGKIQPLEPNPVILPHGSPLALLGAPDAPWPSETGREAGMKFLGYQLNSHQYPTVLYSYRDLKIEDFLESIENFGPDFQSEGRPGFSRTIKFSAAPPPDFYLRVATGKLTPIRSQSWRLNDTLTISILTKGAEPFVRGHGENQELLLPLRRPDSQTHWEIDYVW